MGDKAEPGSKPGLWRGKHSEKPATLPSIGSRDGLGRQSAVGKGQFLARFAKLRPLARHCLPWAFSCLQNLVGLSRLEETPRCPPLP